MFSGPTEAPNRRVTIIIVIYYRSRQYILRFVIDVLQYYVSENLFQNPDANTP